MSKILISACLLGQPVRYDGQSKPITHDLITQWRTQGLLVPICPEGLGGLATPRDPAEIVGGTARDVFEGRAKVITDRGEDVTDAFIQGAKRTLKIARDHDVQIAILKQFSPSCGSQMVYDGTFSRHRIDGLGLTTYWLTQHGIEVFDEHQLHVVQQQLDTHPIK